MHQGGPCHTMAPGAIITVSACLINGHDADVFTIGNVIRQSPQGYVPTIVSGDPHTGPLVVDDVEVGRLRQQLAPLDRRAFDDPIGPLAHEVGDDRIGPDALRDRQRTYDQAPHARIFLHHIIRRPKRRQSLARAHIR